MKVKSNECSWFRLDFLGYEVGEEGFSKFASCVENVDQFPRPETIKKLREFLRLINFQRKFILICSVATGYEVLE